MSSQQPINQKLNSDRTILVVDDSPQNLDLLMYGLSSKGFRVLTALNTTDGREKLLTNNVDVLLLDVNMPGQNGFDFCKELRDVERFELLPVIFVSSMDRSFGFREAIENGGDDFINKPINLNELVSKIYAFIRIKNLHDQLKGYKVLYEDEIRMARKVQSHLIPERNIELKGYRVRTLLKPFNQIGGDFFDIWEEGENLFFIIADCSGTGVSASLLSAMLKMQVISLSAEFSLEEKLKSLRAKMNTVLPKDFYITFFFGKITPEQTLEYINGGHPPVFYCQGGKIEVLQSNSAMITEENVTTGEEKPAKVMLREKSRLLLYTDGASEVLNPQYQMLGVENLKNMFLESAAVNGNTVETMFEKIREFSGDNPIEDDIALITIES